MATNFPSSLDNSTSIPAESANTKLSTNHVTAHQNIQDAIEAIEAKVGVDGSAVTTTHDYKLSEVTSSDKVVGKTATQTLTNKTLTSPVINVGSDATGDIYYRNSGGSFTRLGIGSTDQLLKVSGGLPSWATPSADNKNYIADTGTTNALVATLVPALGAYAAGVLVQVKVANTNTGATTINVNGLGAKTIKKGDGTSDLVAGDIVAGQVISLEYDGTNFQMQSPVALPLKSNYQVFTASGTWTKPSGLSGNEIVFVQLWGAGGGGGGCANATSSGAGGGGGGAYTEAKFRASDLSSTVTVTLGSGGAGGVGLANGSAGGNSTFGSYLTAYGGGGGSLASGTNTAGGGGGGNSSAGVTANNTTTGGDGGGINGSTGTAGAGAGNSFGGAAGGGNNQAGGSSTHGGGGGGSGGGSGVGGSGYFGGAGGGGGGITTGNNGGTGIVYGGNGGNGGGNANGSNGTAPGGGGGGSGNNGGTAKTGGTGARGECRVFVSILAN